MHVHALSHVHACAHTCKTCSAHSKTQLVKKEIRFIYLFVERVWLRRQKMRALSFSVINQSKNTIIWFLLFIFTITVRTASRNGRPCRTFGFSCTFRQMGYKYNISSIEIPSPVVISEFWDPQFES